MGVVLHYALLARAGLRARVVRPLLVRFLVPRGVVHASLVTFTRDPPMDERMSAMEREYGAAPTFFESIVDELRRWRACHWTVRLPQQRRCDAADRAFDQTTAPRDVGRDRRPGSGRGTDFPSPPLGRRSGRSRRRGGVRRADRGAAGASAGARARPSERVVEPGPRPEGHRARALGAAPEPNTQRSTTRRSCR